MKRDNYISAIFLTALTFFICNCNAQPVKDKSFFKEAKIAITKSNETYFQAFAKGDASLFISHYTYDCWIMPSNAPTLCGVDAPADFFQTAYSESGVRNGKFISIDISGNGEEFVTETGFYHFFNVKSELIEDGKYLVLWKKTDEGWKMFRNSFSPNHKTK